MKVTCLCIGNPHCVIPLTEVSEKLAKDIGALIEVHSMFPKESMYSSCKLSIAAIS